MILRESLTGATDVNHGGRGNQSPEFGEGDTNANYPPLDFVMFQNFNPRSLSLQCDARIRTKTAQNSPKHAVSSKKVIYPPPQVSPQQEG